MNKIFFIFNIILFLFNNTYVYGQEDPALKDARNAFAREDYWQSMVLCKESRKYPPKTNMLRENLLQHSRQCYMILENRDCDTIELYKIKKIRSNYNLLNSPKTDAKIKNCLTPGIQEIKQDLQKLEFVAEQIVAEESYPLTDTTQLEIIHNFLKKFADSFKKKDLNFIEMVFNDFALIIHEHTQVKYKIDKNGNRIKRVYTRKTEKDKEQYLADLRKAFNDTQNEAINVDFHEIEIYRSNKDPNVYGINFLQIWQSPSNFEESGVGWIFLDIDFTNIEEPSIWIKTWQSHNTPEEKRYWLGSFKIVRGK